MFQTRFVCLLGLLVGLWSPIAPSLPAASADLREERAAKVDAIVKDGGITEDAPGAAVMVINNGRVVFQKGYGLANVENRTRITPETTFELASVSKQFAGIAVMILHDRGKLSFDDDVRKYVPELPEYNKKRPIRIMDLSRHTSGLPEYFNFEDVTGRDPKFLVNEDYAKEFARLKDKHPLQFPTGTKSQYTNTNYMLLALIVERVSGKSFGTFLRDEVFKPLEMKTAWVNESPTVKTHSPATAYQKNKKGEWKATWSPPTKDYHETLLTTGDGAVWCSLVDMARWDAGLREGKLVKPETWQLGLGPAKAGNGKDIDYGCGWCVGYDDGGRPVFMNHAGGWAGFGTFIQRDLQNNLTLVFLSNRGGFKSDTVINPVWELYAANKRKKE